MLNELLAGRNQQPLSEGEQQRVAYAFAGLDPAVNVRYEERDSEGRLTKTGFRVIDRGTREERGEIVFGPDIFPGIGVVDPNSSLGMTAAAAHELSHYHRWNEKIELPSESTLQNLDEALTSLQAISRYERHLSSQDITQLAADAFARLQLYVKTIQEQE